MSKGMDEQLKLAHNVVDLVERANKKNCVTLLRYSVDRPDNSYAQVGFIARKIEDEKFRQIVYMSYKHKQVISLFDRMKFLYDKVVFYEYISNIL